MVAHHLAKVRVAGSSPVVRSKGPRDLVVEWPRGEATACKAVYTGSNPVSTSTYGAIASPGGRAEQHTHHQSGRLAQGLARFLDTEEVTGSNPVSPTFVKRRGVSSPMRPLHLRSQVDGHEIATAAGPR